MMTDDTPKLVPLGVMARRLRVRSAWLRAEAEAGRLPHVPADPGPLFDPQVVERVLLERARAVPATREGVSHGK